MIPLEYLVSIYPLGTQYIRIIPDGDLPGADTARPTISKRLSNPADMILVD